MTQRIMHICDECSQPCQALSPESDPKKSEWYCPRCHKSWWLLPDGSARK